MEGGLAARLVDRADHLSGPYDYNHHHEADDFLPLARAMTRAQAIVFASPVYWYSMSAQMKTFFDRMTDLTETHKALGKALAGTSVFAVSTSGSKTAPQCFVAPFAGAAD